NAEVIARAGGEAIVVAADVSSSGDVERIVADTLDRFGRIDCVFNDRARQLQGLAQHDRHASLTFPVLYGRNGGNFFRSGMTHMYESGQLVTRVGSVDCLR